MRMVIVRTVKGNKLKLQIRRIHDINDNVYDIFDIMENILGVYWVSVVTYFQLEDALLQYPDIEIEDARKD